MNKKLYWFLTLSLACNVFLGALVGTHLAHGPKGGPPRPERILDDMVQVLPPADAGILRTAIEAHRGELVGEVEPPFQKLRQVLSTEPFDLDAFKKVESEFRAKRELVGAVIGQVMVEALPKMSAEGRKRLAEFRPPPPK